MLSEMDVNRDSTSQGTTENNQMFNLTPEDVVSELKLTEGPESVVMEENKHVGKPPKSYLLLNQNDSNVSFQNKPIIPVKNIASKKSFTGTLSHL